jgi:hypothetical protein
MAKPCSIFGAYLMSRSFEQVSIVSNASIMNQINTKRRNYYTCQHKLHSLLTDAIRGSLCIKELCSLALGHASSLPSFHFISAGRSSLNQQQTSHARLLKNGHSEDAITYKDSYKLLKNNLLQHSGRRVLKSTETDMHNE